MAHISKEELLKIAKMAQLKLYDHEIDALVKQIQDVLNYAIRVQEIAADVQEVSTKNKNVVRPDSIVKTDPEPILALAPEQEGNYFVVPKIIESK